MASISNLHSNSTSTQYRETYACVQVDLSEAISTSDALQWLEIRLTELEAQGANKGTYLELNAGELVLTTSLVAKMRGLALRYGFVLTTLCSTVGQTQQSGLTEGLTVRSHFEVHEASSPVAPVEKTSSSLSPEKTLSEVDLPPLPNTQAPTSQAAHQVEAEGLAKPNAKPKYQFDDDILGSLLKKPKAIHHDIFALPEKTVQSVDPQDYFEAPPKSPPVFETMTSMTSMATAPQTLEARAVDWNINESSLAASTPIQEQENAQLRPQLKPIEEETTSLESHGIPETLLAELRKASQEHHIQNLQIQQQDIHTQGPQTPEPQTQTPEVVSKNEGVDLLPPEYADSDATPDNSVNETPSSSPNSNEANDVSITTPSLRILLDDGTEQSINLSQDVVGETLLYQQNLRSGQVLETRGNVVLLGDAHAGSEIKAGGDIVVWGTLCGVAHAGAYGRTQSTIRAFRIEALQLRIGPIIARRPDKLFKKEANLTKNSQHPVMRTDIARIVNSSNGEGHEIRVSEELVRV